MDECGWLCFWKDGWVLGWVLGWMDWTVSWMDDISGAVRASLTFLSLSKTDLFLLFILIPISIFKAEGYGR